MRLMLSIAVRKAMIKRIGVGSGLYGRGRQEKRADMSSGVKETSSFVDKLQTRSLTSEWKPSVKQSGLPQGHGEATTLTYDILMFVLLKKSRIR